MLSMYHVYRSQARQLLVQLLVFNMFSLVRVIANTS